MWHSQGHSALQRSVAGRQGYERGVGTTAVRTGTWIGGIGSAGALGGCAAVGAHLKVVSRDRWRDRQERGEQREQHVPKKLTDYWTVARSVDGDQLVGLGRKHERGLVV